MNEEQTDRQQRDVISLYRMYSKPRHESYCARGSSTASPHDRWPSELTVLVVPRTRRRIGDRAFNFCCCTASMEHATVGAAETAAIDGLVSSWSENIFVSFCLRAPGYGLILWCALGLLVVGAIQVPQLQLPVLACLFSREWSTRCVRVCAGLQWGNTSPPHRDAHTFVLWRMTIFCYLAPERRDTDKDVSLCLVWSTPWNTLPPTVCDLSPTLTQSCALLKNASFCSLWDTTSAPQWQFGL